jgi:hypothetical protein
MRSLKKAMRGIPEPERTEGVDMAEAAEQTFVMIGAPSQLGSGVAAFAIEQQGVNEGSPMYGQATGCVLMGYACRMGQNLAVPNDVVARIEPHLLRGENGDVELERLASEPEHFQAVVEWIATVADDVIALTFLAGCSFGAWQSFSATAAFSLQNNLVANGLPKVLLIPAEGMDNLMRLGYAIRLVDEVAGLEPLAKVREQRSP